MGKSVIGIVVVLPTTLLAIHHEDRFSAMSTVKDIESAITQLEPKDVKAVADWLQEYREELWDKQIEADANAGRLDKLMEEAKQDYLAGHCQPLP